MCGGGWLWLSPCQPLGSQSSKQRDTEDLGSLPRFLADSALISVVLKENLMFWLLFWGTGGEGGQKRVGGREF